MTCGPSRAASLSFSGVKTDDRQGTMQTLVVLHSESAAGPARHVFPWISLLAERGPVTFAVPSAGPAADLYSTIGTPIVLEFEPLTYPRRLGALAPYAVRLAAEVRRFSGLIRQLGPDLVVAVTASVPAALVAARLQRVPSAVFVGEILDKGVVVSRGRSVAAAATARLTAAAADGVVCCSDAVARQFARARSPLLRTIYPGVDGAYANGDGARFRALHGLTAAEPCLAVVGNVTPARGQDIAIRALPGLREEFPGVRLVIAGVPHSRTGDLAYRQELVGLARRLGVGDAVAFVGLVDRVADLYAAADVVVNPARFKEPFGRVAIEALSAGRPVVAARVGAIPEVVRDGREALLFPAEDHEALRCAVARLWREPGLRGELVRNGRRRVSEDFREDRGVEAFADFVDRILAASKPVAAGTSAAASG